MFRSDVTVYEIGNTVKPAKDHPHQADTSNRSPWLSKTEMVIMAIAFVAVSVMSFRAQRFVLTFGDVPPGGADDVLRMAIQLDQHEPVAAISPHVYRIGTPWLAVRLVDRGVRG